MGFISNKISRADLKAGDHIYTWRTAFLYAHHGIYIGDGKVINYTRRRKFLSSNPTSETCVICKDQSNLGGVVCSCLDCFLAGDDLYLFNYSVSRAKLVTRLRGGTCTRAHSDAPEQVIYRAKYHLEHGFGKYQFLKNNCEDFAIYCKTGLVASKSIVLGRSGQASSVSLLSFVALMYHPLACNVTRLYTDIGGRKDAKKVPVGSLL